MDVYRPELRTDDQMSAEELRYERAKKAIRNFRAMQPQLSAFAKALTGRDDVKVRPAAGTPSTDGNTIFMRPYMEMADATDHNRRVCDKRDERGILICKGCRARQDTLTTLFHEVGHIAYESFQAITDYQKRKALEKSIKEHRAITGSKRAKLIEAVWRKRNPESYFEASHLISPFLPIIFNALEDARVNRLTYQAYEGTFAWFQAHSRQVFEVGIELPDGSYQTWDDAPLNAQVIVGMFAVASKLTIAGYFDPKVEDALYDDELNRLIEKVDSAKNAKDIYHLGFPILERLRELGFCKHPDDIEPEEDEGPSGKGGMAPPPTEEDLMSGGDDDGGEGGGTPVTVLVDEDLAPDEEEADDDDDEAAPDGPGHVVDLRTEEPDDDDDDGPDDDTGADDGGGAGDDTGADEDATDGEEADDGGAGADPDPADDGGADDDPSSDDDVSPGDGEMGDVPERSDTSDGPSDYEDAGDGEGDSDDEYDPEADSSWGDETGDSSKGEGSGSQATGGDSTGTTDDEAISEDASDAIPESGSPGGGGAREATDVDAEDYIGEDDTEELWGDPDDVEKLVKAFGGHDKEHDDDHHHVAHEETPVDRTEIDRALKTGDVFDRRTEGVPGGVREHEYENRHQDIYGDEAQRGSTYMPEAWSKDGEPSGYYGDAHNVTPPEEVLGPALSKLRVVFADNRKWKHDRNRKSGRIDGRVLGRRVAVGDERIFHKRTLPGRKDYHVLIGLDISGSTSGGKIVTIKAAGFAQAELLSRLGVDFEMYAHTGGSTREGAALDIFTIKKRNEPWSTQQKQRLIALRPGYMNLDGHTFEYYRKRLDESDATERILMYYTDGAMPAENYNEELRVLQSEIGICERRGYRIVGVGVGTDSPNKHGLETVRIDGIGDIQKVVNRLERKLQGR